MKLTRFALLAFSVAFCSCVTSASAAPVFSDNFDLVDYTSGRVEENLNDELPGPRQTGDVVSTYSEGGGSAFILDDTSPNGSDSLVVRTLAPSVGAVTTFADLNQDFGPELVGNKYTVSYDVQVDHSPNPGDGWHSFAIGDTIDPDGPNQPSADFGILFTRTGGWQVFRDGISVVNGAVPGIAAGSPYSLQFEFDETIAVPTVSATAITSSGSTFIGVLPLESAGAGTGLVNSGRFFELRALQAASGTSSVNAIVDVKIDNLSISLGGAIDLSADFDDDGDVDGADLAQWQLDFNDANDFSDADADGDSDGTDFLIWQQTFTGSLGTITAVPEPTSMLLLALAGLGCFASRKRSSNA